MQENPEQKQLPMSPEPFGTMGFIVELFHGVGILLGLALLWTLEAVRNVFFRLLDRWNIRPRPSTKASAFPPGRPRRHHVV